MKANPITIWFQERGDVYGVFVDKVKSNPKLRRMKWHCVNLPDSDLKELYALADEVYGNRIVRFEVIRNVTNKFYGSKSLAITYELTDAEYKKLQARAYRRSWSN